MEGRNPMTITGTFQDARRCALALAHEKQELFIIYPRLDRRNEYIIRELTFPGDQPEDFMPMFAAPVVVDYR